MKIKSLLLVLFMFNTAWGATEKKVKSDVEKVTVYLQGAQVFRKAPVTLAPGVTDLVFTNVSPLINPATIQAGGEGAFIILDVRHQVVYPEPPKPTTGTLPKEILAEIALVEDSLTEFNFRKEEIAEKKTQVMVERDMILKNKLTQGGGKSDSLALLKQAMDLFHQKLTEQNNRLAQLRRDEVRVQKTINRLNNRLSELRTYKDSKEPPKPYEPVHNIIVSVSSELAVSGSVDVNYMVSGAGWVPSYDLRSATAAEPVELNYKANVYQNSGEDWDNVKLKLSTSNPNRSNTKPELPTWYINYYTVPRPVVFPGGARVQTLSNVAIVDSKTMEEMNDNMGKMTPAQNAANYSQMVETMTNVEFDIKLKYSIPSDGVNHIVSVKSDKLPSTYQHYLVPKMDSEAFLLARVTGWENLNLLPGNANIFYEGTYVGVTMLNPSVLNDTLNLSLGRDNGVMVTRTRKPVKESTKFLGNDITKTIAYEIRLKNNKARKLNLIVEDQVPVSQNTEIKVEMKDAGDADYNKTTGLMAWRLELDPKTYKSLNFTYEVTHSKDKPLSLY